MSSECNSFDRVFNVPETAMFHCSHNHRNLPLVLACRPLSSAQDFDDEAQGLAALVRAMCFKKRINLSGDTVCYT